MSEPTSPSTNKPVRAQDRVQQRILILSILFGLVAAFFVYAYLQSVTYRISGGKQIPVAVAAVRITPGTILTPDLLTTSKVPEVFLHQKAVHAEDLKRLYGRKTVTVIEAGEPMLYNDLFPETRQTLSDKLQSNQRAVSIAFDGTRGMSGLIIPGDRVDLLINNRGSTGGNRTKSLLQNVTVMAIDGQTSAYQDLFGEGTRGKSLADAVTGGGATSSRAPKSSTTLTFLLTPKDAAMLIYAQTAGSLQVVLRSPDDLVVDPNISFTESDFNKAGLQSSTPTDHKGAAGFPQVIEGGVPRGTGFLPDMIPQLEQLQELQRRASELQQQNSQPTPKR